MTKPQFSTEPSMEDILASIRKMISEERLGPRPIPDQIGRSPFGESIVEQASRPDTHEPRTELSGAPAERPGPSFSSLSDALNKAATPAPTADQRRTLEEKIADMLESGGLPSRPAAPTDSLAVFAANRQTPAASPDLGPLGRGPAQERAATERAATERTPTERTPTERTGPRQAPIARETPRAARPGPRLPEPPLNGLNGSAHTTDAKPADASTVVPLAPEAPSAPSRETASRPSPSLGASVGPSAKLPGGDAASPAPAKNADAQRIIAMPSRLGAGAGPAMTSTGSGLNGASVSSLGPRPVTGGRHSFRPASPLRDSDAGSGAPAGKSGEAERDSVTARSTDTGFRLGDSAIRGKRDDATGGEETGRVEEPAKPSFGPAADMPRSADAAAQASADAASEVSSDDKTASPFAKPTTSGGSPSDALVDAVVALVHKEPDSLSVFTSGSAFIHGVAEEAAAAMPAKPGPNMARKLDRSAAELLRPMLRQWLADNMPRIVEEALRSELMNAQDPVKEPDKK